MFWVGWQKSLGLIVSKYMINIKLNTYPKNRPDWGSECIVFTPSKGFLIAHLSVHSWHNKETKEKINDVTHWQYTGYFKQ